MLKLINVKKVYTTKAGDTKALDGINLTFPDTGMVFITGKSGSGKTTMLNIIGGLDGVTEGEIVIDGKEFSKFTAKEYDSYRNTYIGFIFQEYNLLNDFTVAKNVEMANELQGKRTDSKTLEEVLATVDIKEYERRKPNELSGGQRQRVAIARALIKNPKVIMADEPTGALDSNTGVQVMDALKKLSKTKLVLVISHDLELAEKYADRIVTIKDGRIKSDVTISYEEIKGNVYEDDKTVSVKGGVDLSDTEVVTLLKAIKNKKKVEINDSISVKKKENTIQPEEFITKKKEVHLISSKMKFSSSALLGLKSLKTKPVRLIFTIFLAVLAFAIFGIFDTVASYSTARMLTKALVNSGYDSVAMTATYYHDEENKYDIRFSQNEIDGINSKTGLNFRGIYEFYDKANIDNGETLLYQLTTKFSTKYYKKGITGIIEFRDDEVDKETKTVGVGTYNYKIIYGSYPKLGGDGDYQIAITKYFADVLVALYGKGEYGFTMNGTPITKMEDFIGQYINISGRTDPKFYITGIVDCGDIPSKYDELKTATSSKNIETLINDYDTYLSSTPNQCVFVCQGFTEKYMNRDSARRSALMYSEDGAITVNGNVLSVNYLYNSTASTKSNTISLGKELFDNDGNSLLEEGEIIVDVTYFDTVFYKDVCSIVKSTTDRTDVINKINIMKSTKATISMQDKQTVLTELFEIFNKYASTLQARDVSLEKEITVTKEITNRKVTNSVTAKIVGFYYRINPDFSVGYSPVILSDKDLEKLEIYPNQGVYSRIITPVSSSKDLEKLVDYMTVTNGVRLNWFGNEIINSIDYYGVQVQQFFDIFLYVSLVLALFSIFMLFNYISTSISSKRQTIGVLRALGSCGKDIFIMFTVESVIIAIINGIFASILTGVGSIFVNKYIREIMNISLDFSFFSIRQVIFIFAFSIITAIIASIMPIIRIAKEKPVDLIRKE